MSKDVENELNLLDIQINDAIFNEYINADIYERSNNKRLSNIHILIDTFNLNNLNNEKLIELKLFLTDKYERNRIFNFNTMIKGFINP